LVENGVDFCVVVEHRAVRGLPNAVNNVIARKDIVANLWRAFEKLASHALVQRRAGLLRLAEQVKNRLVRRRMRILGFDVLQEHGGEPVDLTQLRFKLRFKLHVFLLDKPRAPPLSPSSPSGSCSCIFFFFFFRRLFFLDLEPCLDNSTVGSCASVSS